MRTLLPFHWHIIELLVVAGIAWAHRFIPATPRQHRCALASMGVLAVVTAWPIGDLAQSVSLTVATVQRLVIMLLVAPLILLSLPVSLLSRLTRPAPVDAVVRRVAHPGVAIVIVTIVGTLSLAVPVVDWGAVSATRRDVVLLLVVVNGLVLWVPGLALMPGAKRLSPAGRAGYLLGSALVVTSLSYVWIFAQHPLYPALHYQHALLHISPLFDQQLAGYIAKLGCFIPMGAVAFTIFFRAEDRGVPVEETPLDWADVERLLLRVERHRARAARHQRRQ